MIDTLYIANLIQEELNKNAFGKKFLIFADEGDLVKSTGKGKYKVEYTHGIIQSISDSVVPIENVVLQTVNASLMILVDLGSSGYENVVVDGVTRKQFKSLIETKQCLDSLLSAINGTSRYVDIDGKVYNMTISMSRPTNGEKTELGEINEAFPLYISFQFVIFENGVNANLCGIKVNGELLSFTQMTQSKICTNDQNETLDNGGAKSYTLVGGKSFDFVAPLTNSGVTHEFIDFLLGYDTNNAFCVEIIYPWVEKQYICILGKVQSTLVKGTNVGLNISFLEGKQNVLTYDSRWVVNKYTTETISLLGMKKGYIIFYGDGNATKVDSDTDVSYTYTDGRKNHVVRIYTNGE